EEGRCGIGRLCALCERIREAQRALERRLGLGEAAESEECPAERAQRTGFTRNGAKPRFGAEQLVREILCLRELSAIERGVGQDRESARESGEIADRGGVLDAALGRAKRFVGGARVGSEDRDGFLRRERETTIVRG